MKTLYLARCYAGEDSRAVEVMIGIFESKEAAKKAAELSPHLGYPADPREIQLYGSLEEYCEVVEKYLLDDARKKLTPQQIALLRNSKKW